MRVDNFADLQARLLLRRNGAAVVLGWFVGWTFALIIAGVLWSAK